jgi:hypothetical protein
MGGCWGRCERLYVAQASLVGRTSAKREEEIWAGGCGSIKKDYAGFNISKTRVTGSPQLINSTKSDAEQCARYANFSPTTPPPICCLDGVGGSAAPERLTVRGSHGNPALLLAGLPRLVAHALL